MNAGVKEGLQELVECIHIYTSLMTAWGSFSYTELNSQEPTRILRRTCLKALKPRNGHLGPCYKESSNYSSFNEYIEFQESKGV